MVAKKLINQIVPPLKPEDTVQKALSWMGEFHVQHLPIIGVGRVYVGTVSEYDLIDIAKADDQLKDLELSMEKIAVREGDHVYEVMKTMHEHQISTMPVLDQEEAYVGLITLDNLLSHFADASALKDPGGIIILEMAPKAYALSEISKIVEMNDANVLSMYVSQDEKTRSLAVTLKINKSDLNDIIATFERYEYMVKASYQEEDYLEDLKGKLDEFMHYLNI